MFVKFIVTSATSSLIDLGLFTLLCYCFKRSSIESGYYIIISTIIARICSATYNFLINYKVVFKSETNIKKAVTKYVCLAIIQMMISGILVNLVYPITGGYEVFVKIPVDIFLFLVNYIVQKKLIYK